MRKHIVFLTLSLHTGGGTRVFIELANRLAVADSVEILCPANRTKTSFEINHNVIIKPCGISDAGFIVNFYNLLILIFIAIFKRRQSIIIISDPIFSILPLFFKRARTIRFVQSDDYNIYNDGHVLKHWSIIKVYKLFTRISYALKIEYIFNSRFSYEQFIAVSKRRNVPYQAVLPGVNLAVFKPLDHHDEIESMNNKIQIAIVARAHPMKGFQDFVAAWYNSALVEYKNLVNIVLISPDDLSSFNIAGMKLRKPQNDSELAFVLQRTDIFVFTSWWEGFGLPPLEAMACGCAVIMPAIKGVQEYAIDGQNCLLYQPRNAAELALKIKDLIKDTKKREKLRKFGVDTAQRFTWAHTEQQIKPVINKYIQ